MKTPRVLNILYEINLEFQQHEASGNINKYHRTCPSQHQYYDEYKLPYPFNYSRWDCSLTNHSFSSSVDPKRNKEIIKKCIAHKFVKI